MIQQFYFRVSEEIQMLIQKSVCTPMFIAALFTIAKVWKQPKSPSVDKRVRKMWYPYAMEYY